MNEPLLLDTVTFLWLATDDPKLRFKTREAIVTSRAPVYVSVVSLWEIGLKKSLGRLPLPLPSYEFFEDVSALMEIEPSPFGVDAAGLSERLPMIHRDPFDRMIVAHAISLGAILVTGDAEMLRYPVRTLWE